ncbi:ComEC/Rec2 family competence protein [Sphingomonas sp.]|uniref:ComEC/Rec2 family competence protein n=1 Tax=Sphingomonas sp. TaxID=28214 RepID=UPI003AFF64C8
MPIRAAIETWLEAEREQLPLWLPVGLAGGVLVWFLLPGPPGWIAFLCASSAAALGGMAFGGRGRALRAVVWFGACLALGCALTWWRAERPAGPRLDRPTVVRFAGEIDRVEPLPARAAVRLTLRPAEAGLPRRVRVTVPQEDAPEGLVPGASVAIRARLMPPPSAAVPGAYDYAAVAWFRGIGAAGKALEPVRVIRPATRGGPARWLADARVRLSRHILASLPGPPGGVAVALATGDMGGVPFDDNDAFRRSGLAHLLSVSGLHLTAAVGAAMLLSLRLLALSRRVAIRLPVPLIAAATAALVGIAYTLMTGAEVPTVRSLVAALIVLAGTALSREALTLRLVATGALFCLLVWPEQAAGPSFQLSFAAILAIVAFHDLDGTRRWLSAREESGARRWARALAGLLATGLVVELALMPIALFHFHRAGFYGAAANIIAIPLTTFVIMPTEAAALLADLAGLGAPLWWIAGLAIRLLLGLAHHVSALPGASALVPTLSRAGFAAIVSGGLWLALWRTRVRLLGWAPIVAGLATMLANSPPDIVVTGDGRHVAVRTRDGGVALLRERTGEYLRSALSEVEGGEGDAALAIDDLPGARCGPDLCAVTIGGGKRTWRLLATRSHYPVDREAFAPACARADIVVSDRRLPGWCAPRWLKADATLLARTGGLAIRLVPPSIVTVAEGQSGKPWARTPPTPEQRDVVRR